MTSRPGRPWRPARRALSTAVVLLAALLLPVAAHGDSVSSTGTVSATGTASASTKVAVRTAGTVSVSLSWTDPSADLNLFVTDPAGASVLQLKAPGPGPEAGTFQATTVGSYRFTVKAKTGSSSYTLGVSRPDTPAAVQPVYESTLGGGGTGHADMYPSGLDVDPAGIMYVADTGDDQIQAYSRTGALLWTTGSRGPKTAGRFENPRDVAYLDGKVYVADTGYRRVQVLDAATGTPASIWPTTFGTVMGISGGVDAAGKPVVLVSESSANVVRVFTPGGTLVRTIGAASGDGAMNDVRDAATDATGRVYTADYKNNRVLRFSATGAYEAIIATGGTGPDQIKRPYGVDIDGAGRVYVADGNDRIQVYGASGGWLQTYGERGPGPGKFEMLRRVAVDDGPSPRVCGADLWRYKVECFAATGAPSATLGGTGPQPGQYNEPYGVAVDDHIFVMDTTNQRAQQLSLNGTPVSQFGERGWGEGNAGFNWARDIATMGGTTGTLWVADTKNSRLLEFDRAGTPTSRVLGQVGPGPGELFWPFALDSYGGDLIVADTRNHRILRWNPDQSVPLWTATGFDDPKDLTVVGDVVYVADSENQRVVKLSAMTGAVLGTFGEGVLHRVEGIAVAPDGVVWVSDTSWNRLVSFGPDGTVRSTFGGLGSEHGRFNVPSHLAIATRNGVPRLYVVDQWNDRIEVFRIG